MISIEDARQFVLSRCRRSAPVELPPREALGLVLAESVRAGEDVPPFANSSMDGYAVWAADVSQAPTRLRVVGALMAGDDPGTVQVGVGEAVRIMTGAAVPRGADAVCMVERTLPDGDHVVVEEALAPGTFVRPAGSDVAAGDEVFAADERITAAHVGILTSLGIEKVVAYPRPRVGVVSTGDELVSGPGPLPIGKIRDSNRPGLLAQLGVDGFAAIDLGQAADDPAVLAKVVQQGVLECDAVITSGGVSVGDRDIVKMVLEELGGANFRWLQVAVKPAKPFAFSTVGPGDVPVFGLPGNPVSALVSYELFARPALRLMAGSRSLFRPVVRATAGVDLRRAADGRLHLMRVALSIGPDGTFTVKPSGGQASHQMMALAGANAFAVLPDGEGVAAGSAVMAWLLDVDGLGDGGGQG